MSGLRELLSHSSNYFVGRVLILLAGFISMPVLTRILSKDDYGLMSLVFLSLTILGTIAMIGFPQAVTRLYPEYKEKGGFEYIRHLCTNISIGSIVSASIVVFIAVGISYFLENSSSFSKLGYYLRYVSVLILIRVLTGVFLQIYRAEKSPFMYNLITVTNRYLTVFCSIFLVIYIYKNIMGVLVATIAVEGIILVICAIFFLSRGRLGVTKISPKIMSEAIRFGFPLVIADLLTSLMTSGDRFIIQYYLDSAAVATYSVAYDISDYIGALFVTPVRLAIIPIIFSLWVDKGHEKTSVFLSRVIKYTFAGIIPVIFGFSILGEKIIILLASSKYSDSGVLVPFIISGVMLVSIHFLFFIGLLVQKKTAVLSFLNLAAGVFNIILNLFLIPHYGVLGAAFTTLVTYIILLFVTYRYSSQFLKIQMEWTLIFKAIFISIAMSFILYSLGDVSNKLIVDIVIKSTAGFLFYTTSLLIVDKEIRDLVLQKIIKKV